MKTMRFKTYEEAILYAEKVAGYTPNPNAPLPEWGPGVNAVEFAKRSPHHQSATVYLWDAEDDYPWITRVWGVAVNAVKE